MFRWLSYRNDPKSASQGVQKDFFQRREFTFVLQGDIFCRYQCFKDMEEYKAKVLERQPIRMEIGAVFSHAPSKHNLVSKDAAIQVLKRALEQDFGFQHILFVYSGRRGVHCWVCDTEARKLSNEQRSAVAEYLTLVSSGAGKCRADLKFFGSDELHPSVEEAYKICKKWFEEPNGILQSQDILRKDLPHLERILEPFSVAEQQALKKYINEENTTATSMQIWRKIEKIANERKSGDLSSKQRLEAKVLLKDVTIQFTYPRLDINVSKQMNHLLKSPFVVHPKTGRVCVPIDPDGVNAFDPAQVPTIGKLVEELQANGGDVSQTSLKPYLHYFETKFLQHLEKTSTEELRAKTSQMGVLTDF